MDVQTAEAAGAILAGIAKLDGMIAVIKAAQEGSWQIGRVELWNPADAAVMPIVTSKDDVSAEITAMLYAGVLQDIETKRATLAAQLEAL